MDRGLQEIVDALSLSLGRPVLIDDAELRPLAYSSQFGELDDVRTASILGRHAPDEARVALFDEGIRTAAGPVHIPARPEIGMRARVCVPLGRRRETARLPVAVRGAARSPSDELRLARCGGGRGRGARRARRRRAAAAPAPRAAARRLAAERRAAPGGDGGDRAGGRALPAAAAGVRVGRRARGPGGRRVERRGAGPAARRLAAKQAICAEFEGRLVCLAGARAGRQRGDGGARCPDRAAGAGGSGRSRRGAARRAHVVPPCPGGAACGCACGVGDRELGSLGVERVVTALPGCRAGRPTGRAAPAARRRPGARADARGLPRSRG